MMKEEKDNYENMCDCMYVCVLCVCIVELEAKIATRHVVGMCHDA